MTGFADQPADLGSRLSELSRFEAHTQKSDGLRH